MVTPPSTVPLWLFLVTFQYLVASPLYSVVTMVTPHTGYKDWPFPPPQPGYYGYPFSCPTVTMITPHPGYEDWPFLSPSMVTMISLVPWLP